MKGRSVGSTSSLPIHSPQHAAFFERTADRSLPMYPRMALSTCTPESWAGYRLACTPTRLNQGSAEVLHQGRMTRDLSEPSLAIGSMNHLVFQLACGIWTCIGPCLWTCFKHTHTPRHLTFTSCTWRGWTHGTNLLHHLQQQ